jgi:hypothetical protein
VTVGAVVWAVIGACWVVWLAATTAVSRLPGIERVVRAFLGAWGGRAVALAAWSYAGWHLFCQRP